MVLLHQDWRLVGDELNVEELTFNIEVEQGNSKCCVKELLLGAQLRHKIFCEDFGVKAFYWFYCACVGFWWFGFESLFIVFCCRCVLVEILICSIVWRL